MKVTIHKPEAMHYAFRDDCVMVLRKHAGHLTSMEMLALASQMVGQIIAMQDQRTMTSSLAMEIVARNIEVGNAHVLNELAVRSEGSA